METEEYEGILITTVASFLESLGQCFRTRFRGFCQKHCNKCG